MWQLVPETGAGDPYNFLTGIEYVVGRKNCAILIQDDQSISRAHAVLSVKHSRSNLSQPHIIPILTIKDSSKYGTFINEEKMENSQPMALKWGDKVTFGVFNSKYRVEYEPLVVSSSCLNGPEKESLNQALLQLGGHVLGNWTGKCTHLVMSSVKITIKTICALICCRPIVLPEYFNEQLKCIQQKTALPSLASFLPSIDEPSLKSRSVDLSANENRKKIFKDKVFLFLNAKQLKKLSPAVTLGGGEAKLLKEDFNDPSVLENPKACVIDIGTTDSQLSLSDPTQSWTCSVFDVLQSKNLRAIPESEIGLAVLYVSTEMYCNPRRCLDSGNETGTCKTNIISQSMAVEETLLPAPTLNITAYVTNTEPQEETVMDISGVQEVKETPKSNHRGSDSKMHSEVSPSSIIDIKRPLFNKEYTAAEKMSQQLPRSDLGRNKGKMSQKSLTNPIKNFFQPISKKREREEDHIGTSYTKLAKAETLTSRSEESVESQVDDKRSLASQDETSDLDTEPILPDSDKFKPSDPLPSQKDGASKKRKELEEDLVEESDLESDRDVNDDKMDKSVVKCNISNGKRMRMETLEDHGRLQRTSQSTIDLCASKKEAKTEPESQNEKKFIKPPKEENELDGLPSRIVLTEFKSLVVSRPSRNRQFNASTNNENVLNFKKFKKVSYPGAGGFPRIIGGSDLFAHDRKKNSELEQWLRQEAEEQTQQAREDLMAEDLFRYNPNSKRRR